MTAILKIFGLPGTIALAAAVLLALMLSACSIGLVLAYSDLKVANAELSLAELERDSAVATAGTNATAAGAWEVIATDRLVLLNDAQAENARVAAANETALTRARAQTRDAERTLAQFTERYAAAIRLPACAAARANLDASCPAMDY